VSTPTAGHNRLELIATVLLSVATVATAWSGYQSTRWNAEQAKAGARANALRIESTRSSDLANTETEIDVATFTQWANAYAQKQTMLADFYFKRFRKEFKPAVDAWIATRPLKNPSAPLTPFAMPQYKLAARAESEQLAPTPMSSPHRRCATSNARRTTSCASSSSRPHCSSRESARS